MPSVISIVGQSKSGKTTLIEKLIPELKNRGYRIGTIKHAHHGFEIDKKGKDSWRHEAAGADMVIVSSSGKIAMVKNENCVSIECLEGYFADMDLVLTEGYKTEKKPKIEIFRSAAHKKPVCLKDESLIAIVTDDPIETNVPKYGLEEITALANLIENKYLAGKTG